MNVETTHTYCATGYIKGLWSRQHPVWNLAIKCFKNNTGKDNVFRSRHWKNNSCDATESQMRPCHYLWRGLSVPQIPMLLFYVFILKTFKIFSKFPWWPVKIIQTHSTAISLWRQKKSLASRFLIICKWMCPKVIKKKKRKEKLRQSVTK